MITRFIITELDLATAGCDLPAAIEALLRQQGEPLRWAITAVEQGSGIATIEAVVTVEDP